MQSPSPMLDLKWVVLLWLVLALLHMLMAPCEWDLLLLLRCRWRRIYDVIGLEHTSEMIKWRWSFVLQDRALA